MSCARRHEQNFSNVEKVWKCREVQRSAESKVPTMCRPIDHTPVDHRTLEEDDRSLEDAWRSRHRLRPTKPTHHPRRRTTTSLYQCCCHTPRVGPRPGLYPNKANTQASHATTQQSQHTGYTQAKTQRSPHTQAIHRRRPNEAHTQSFPINTTQARPAKTTSYTRRTPHRVSQMSNNNPSNSVSKSLVKPIKSK